MTFEVGAVGRFTAQHHLVGDFGPASLPHSHAYRVEVSASGGSLQANGTLFDITLLQTTLRTSLDALEGHDLNALPRLAQPNPTAEVVARFICDHVANSLSNTGVRRLSVRVWESDEAYAAYTRELD